MSTISISKAKIAKERGVVVLPIKVYEQLVKSAGFSAKRVQYIA